MRERLVALAVLLTSGGYLLAALPLARGTGARPGPGFFPFAVGVFLCAVSLAFVIASVRGATGVATAAEALAPAARGRVLTTAGTLVGSCLFLPWIGYPAMAFLFVALLLRALGGRGWITIVATALVSSAASYYLFAVLLGVPLPRGPWMD
jgi:putative tricarboxylic transport membrane protein